MLESSELALNRTAREIELARPLGLPRDQRVETIGFDPRTCRVAFPGWAAPFRCPVLVIRATEYPRSMAAAGRLVLAALDPLCLAEGRDLGDAAVHAALVDRLVVVALVRDRNLDRKSRNLAASISGRAKFASDALAVSTVATAADGG